MKFRHILLAAAATLWACSTIPVPETDCASWVNPKIGTGAHGHVFVGANVPFGLVQLGPTSISQGWDWCSGYHDSDSTVIGFSHTHLSGTGCGDLLDITFMPVTGPTTPERGREDRPGSGAWSYADRSREVCEPGYYRVPLTLCGITAELTATARVGFHRYTFPATESATVVMDLDNGGNWDRVREAGFEVVKDQDGQVKAVGGYRHSTGWAVNQKLYFWAEFSRPSVQFSVAENPAAEAQGKKDALYGYYTVGHMEEGEQLLVKVALSPVSVEGARANMKAELPGWDFDATRFAAREAWNEELSKIDIDTKDPDLKTVFYTALYHTCVAPSVYNDADGRYRGSDDQIHEGDFQNYTTFSLWDTYRAAMPLMTLIHPEKMDDITATMYHIFREQGDLPVWHLMGNETDCMVGNPGLIAFADNVVKGFRGGLSDQEILEAMTATATRPDRGQNFRMQYGYIPCNLYRESVGTDMEYAIADAALSHAAAFLGRDDIAAGYLERSHSYRHFWDPQTRFFRGKDTEGRFNGPFNPFAPDQGNHDYTEGNAFQYRWLVPQDIEGLEELFGGREATLAALDSLFTAPSTLEGEDIPPDITGLIGQYVHGNEPSHHIIYLYALLGEPDKAADRLRQVYREMYANHKEGLAGNEDVGQMSAWLVLSAMGFYQVEPAVPRYWFGAPLFESMRVSVSGGDFVIKAPGVSSGKGHIRSVTLNGEPYTLPYIEYKDIVAGGTLEFEMQ